MKSACSTVMTSLNHLPPRPRAQRAHPNYPRLLSAGLLAVAAVACGGSTSGVAEGDHSRDLGAEGGRAALPDNSIPQTGGTGGFPFTAGGTGGAGSGGTAEPDAGGAGGLPTLPAASGAGAPAWGGQPSTDAGASGLER
jgi:hypothetical protein